MLTAKDLDTLITSASSHLETQVDQNERYATAVNSPFKNKLYSTSLDLGIVVLCLLNEEEDTVDRVALSNTDPATWAVKMSPVPFNEIRIPASDKNNTLAKAIRNNSVYRVTDWKFLFTPALSPESARFNQAGAGIACSYVYPLSHNNKAFGAMIFSYYQPPEQLTVQHKNFMKRYTECIAEKL